GVFVPVGVQINALDRANDFALRFIVVAHAFSAQVGVDHVVVGPHGYCIIGTFWFTDVAIDAFVSDEQGHVVSLGKASQLLLGPRPASRRSATLVCSQRSTDGNTNLLTSPPNWAISRTMEPEMNWYCSDGVRNSVSTSGSR